MERSIQKSLYRMKKLACAVLIGVAICLGGCGKEPLNNQGAVEETRDNIITSLQWKTQGFAVKDASFVIDMNAPEIYGEIASGEMILPQDLQKEYSDSVLETWYQNDYYVLLEKKETGKKTYALAKDLGSTGRFEMVELSGIEELGYGRIVCMDVMTQDDTVLLYVEENDENQLREAYILHINARGEITTKTSVVEGYGAEGIRTMELVQGLWWNDEEGNSYLLQDGGRSLLIFDAAGVLLKKQEYTTGEDKQVLSGFHAPTGEVIFAVNDMLERKTRLIWWDTSKLQFKELATFPEMYLRGFSMYEDGNIYFVYQSRLWKWNIGTGEGTVMYNILGSSIPGNGIDKYVMHISVLNEEEIKVISRAGEGFQYCLLSSAEPEEDGIVLLDFRGETYIRQCVVGYNKENPEIAIQYERKSNNEENWTRTMAQLSSGKGPDMIFMVSFDERVQTLYEKGVLMDLSNMLSEETLSQIFPGILAAGTIDEKLVGICPQGLPIVFWTADSLWTEEWWSPADILTIVEENPQLEGLYVSDEGASPGSNLGFGVLNHVESSPYVDITKGVSYFEAEDFIKTLEIAKKYGELPTVGGEEKVQKIRNGEYLATIEYVFWPQSFVEMVEKYGEDCHMIGYPGQTEYIGYWTSTGVVLVNEKTEYKEEVAEFLEYLLSQENQQRVTHNCVREDVIRNSVYRSEYDGEWYMKAELGDTYFTKVDGESYLEDYVSFLKKVGPWEADSPIEDIVRQEAAEYFKGGRSAAEIADIIDNRVQLYLDEQ